MFKVQTDRVDERVALIAERPTTIGMLAPGSFVPEPPWLIVGLRADGFPTGDLAGERRLALAFTFCHHKHH